MAGSANSAYMMWRQFSGDAKPTAGQQRAGLRNVQFQGEIQTGKTTAEALDSTLNSLAGFAKQYQQGVKQEEEQADTNVKAWMRTKTVEEYRAAIQGQNTPFQDDPIAMAALHRNSAAALSFEVEEAIQNQVKQGKFKTTEEADKARIEALGSAKNEWFLNGMADGKYEKAFQKGFDIQQDERRFMIQRLQQDVTDKNLRTQAQIGVKTNLTAPMTPEAIRVYGPQFAADYLTRTLDQAQQTGLVRSHEEYAEALQFGIQNLQGVPGGADVLAELGNREVKVMGNTAKLRDFLGGGAFDAAVLKARDVENGQNVERYGAFQTDLLNLTRNGDLAGIESRIQSLSKESNGKTTNEIEALTQARNQVVATRDREIAKLNEKVTRDNEGAGQLYAGMDGIRSFLQGGLVSKDYKDLGFKDAAQGRKGEQLLLDSIQDPQEKIATAIKLAGKFEDGFSANVLEQWKKEGKTQFEMYVDQVSNGNQNAQVPERVQQMTMAFERDPVAFGMAFGDSKEHPYTTLHQAGKEVGMSLTDMVKSKVKWDALPKDRKAEAEKNLTKALGYLNAGQESYVGKSVQAIAANLMTVGISAPTAVETAMENFKKQHVEINKGWVHKSFFTDNSKDAAASEFAEGLFKKTVFPRLQEQLGSPEHVATIYSPVDRSVWVTNLTTGDRVQYSREQMLEEAEHAAEVARLDANIKQTNVMQEAAAKAEKKAKQKERGIFPYNRPEKDIYGPTIKANKEAVSGALKSIKDEVPKLL